MRFRYLAILFILAVAMVLYFGGEIQRADVGGSFCQEIDLDLSSDPWYAGNIDLDLTSDLGEEHCIIEIKAISLDENEWVFVEWSSSHQDFDGSTSDSINFEAYAGDSYEFVAIFEEIPDVEYDLTINSTEGGSVNTPGEGTFTYDEDETVGLEATANEGCLFIGWTGDTNTIADADAYSTTITMDDNYAITANFEESGFTVEELEIRVKEKNTNSVKLEGEAKISGEVNVDIYFQYKQAEDDEWEGTEIVYEIKGAGRWETPQPIEIDSLDSGTLYNARIVVECNVEGEQFTEEVEFTTDSEGEPKTYYTVTFKNWDSEVLKEDTAEHGSNATAPSDPEREGYTFVGWDTDFANVTEDITVTAEFEMEAEEEEEDEEDDGNGTGTGGGPVITTPTEYTVEFINWDGSSIETQTVERGDGATAPPDPEREGYAFEGWDTDFTNVTSDLTVTADFVKIEEDEEEPEPEPEDPKPEIDEEKAREDLERIEKEIESLRELAEREREEPDPDPEPRPDPEPVPTPSPTPDPDPEPEPEEEEEEPEEEEEDPAEERRRETVEELRRRKREVEEQIVEFEAIREEIYQAIKEISATLEEIREIAEEDFEDPREEKGAILNEIYYLANVVAEEFFIREDGTEDIRKLLLEGRGPPDTAVTIHIFSTPIMVSVETDSQGSWSYVLEEELPDGTHDVYIASVDNTGRIIAQSSAFPFTKEAAAVQVGDIPLEALREREEGFFEGVSLLIFLIVLLILVIAGSIVALGALSQRKGPVSWRFYLRRFTFRRKLKSRKKRGRFRY